MRKSVEEEKSPPKIGKKVFKTASLRTTGVFVDCTRLLVKIASTSPEESQQFNGILSSY